MENSILENNETMTQQEDIPSESDIKVRIKSDNLVDIKVYQVLYNKGAQTRAGLIKHTDYARTTIYDSLMRMKMKDLIIEYSEKLGGPGRPKVYFALEVVD